MDRRWLLAGCGWVLGCVAPADAPPPVRESSVDRALAPIPARTRWHLDIENPVDETVDAEWFDIDLWGNVATGLADRLHARGRQVACYFSGGSGEDWRPDYRDIPARALGKPLDGWPGERWLDTRDAGVRAVMRQRLDRARQMGCDAVDPDNVDGYVNASGFALTASTQLDYNRFLAAEAHARGLRIGLKNDVEQIPQLIAAFDFAVNEECFAFQECEAVAAFAQAGKSVLHIEYGDAVVDRPTRACNESRRLGFFTILSRENRMNGTYVRCPAP